MELQARWMWLLVPLLCLWCSKYGFALPIATSANPTQEEIDNITRQDADVG